VIMMDFPRKRKALWFLSSFAVLLFLLTSFSGSGFGANGDNWNTGNTEEFVAVTKGYLSGLQNFDVLIDYDSFKSNLDSELEGNVPKDYNKFYEAVMEGEDYGNHVSAAFSKYIMEKVEGDKKSDYAEEAYYYLTKIGDSQESDAEKYKYYEQGAKVVLEGLDFNANNYEEVKSELFDVLDDAYHEFWMSRGEKQDDSEEAFYVDISVSGNNKAKALLYLWTFENTGDGKYAERASEMFEILAGDVKDNLDKALLYELAAKTLPEPTEERREERYEREKRRLMLESYKATHKYLDKLTDPETKYFGLKKLAKAISELKDYGDGLKDEQELFDEVVKSIKDINNLGYFSWRLRETVDAINLGKSISDKLYRDVAFYRGIEDWFDGVFGEIYSFFDESTIGKILAGKFEDIFCANILKLKGSSYSSTEDGRMGSFIAGNRRKITYNDGSVEYLYKITFMIDTALDSKTGKINYSIKVYDASGNGYHLDLDEDGKANIWMEVEDSYSSTREQPLAWYSSKRFEQACIEFYNVDNFVSHFKELLKKNNNKICTKLAEADIEYVNQQDYNLGNTQQDDDEDDDCANC